MVAARSGSYRQMYILVLINKTTPMMWGTKLDSNDTTKAVEGFFTANLAMTLRMAPKITQLYVVKPGLLRMSQGLLETIAVCVPFAIPRYFDSLKVLGTFRIVQA